MSRNEEKLEKISWGSRLISVWKEGSFSSPNRLSYFKGRQVLFQFTSNKNTHPLGTQSATHPGSSLQSDRYKISITLSIQKLLWNHSFWEHTLNSLFFVKMTGRIDQKWLNSCKNYSYTRSHHWQASAFLSKTSFRLAYELHWFDHQSG